MPSTSIAFVAALSLGMFVQDPAPAPVPPPAPAPDAAPVERTQPIEVGTVRWLRDLDAAVAESQASGLPILLFFQEVPGRDESRAFGATALSHPLVVDTIEEHFVPLCVHNNVPGRDAELLERFGEPPWNYQAFRVVDANLQTLVVRTDTLRTTNMFCEWLLHTFSETKRPAPPQLVLVRDETIAQDHPYRIEHATFAMHCYWEGERKLGALEGVLRTRAGWVGENEVVEVEFDARIVAYADLLAKATELECATRIFTHNQDQMRVARKKHKDLALDLTTAMRPVEPTEQFHELRRTPLGHLALTQVQCTKLNAAVKFDEAGKATFEPSLEHFLTKRQLADLAKLEAALAKNPAAFTGWYPPTRSDALWEYRARVDAQIVKIAEQ
jgi:hypothetical protein